MSDYPLIFRRAQNQPIPGLNSSYNPGQQPAAKPKNKVVARVKPRRQQPAQQDNSDIDAIFRGAKESRGMVRRGMSGAQLNPDGSDPGSGFNQFMKNNPHLDTREKRQNQYAMENQQRMNNIRQQGPAAVDFAKQTKGYTDASGKFIPPTMPSEPSSLYGSGSVSFPDTPTRGTMPDPLTGKTVYMDQYLPQQSDVQKTKYGPNAGEAGDNYFNPGKASISPQMAGKLPAKFKRPIPGIDQIFPSGQSSPPGDGAGSGLVGAGSALGAPGGGPSPEVRGTPRNPYSEQNSPFFDPFDMYGQPQGTPANPFTSDPFAGQAFPQGTPADPYTTDPFSLFGGTQLGANEGPQLPYNQPEQLDALKKMMTNPGYGGSRRPSNFQADFTNYFPGSDFFYLGERFPGMQMGQILDLLDDPAYLSQLR